MGVGPDDLRTILQLKREGHLPARFSVADIGAQQLSNDVLRDPQVIDDYATEFRVKRRRFGNAPVGVNGLTLEELPVDAPAAKEFWEWLGCTYIAADIDTSPHIIPLDLNFDHVPQEHREKYHLVTNFGTTEHVANQLQAMKIIHDLTAVGGIMIHKLPTQGYSNHGLINYNPKFFWMLARSCNYHWFDMRFFYSPDSGPISPDIIGEISRFDPANAASAMNYRVNDSVIFVVMQKRVDMPFVPPIDMHTGGVVNDERIKSRYWSVFGSEGFRGRPDRARLPEVGMGLSSVYLSDLADLKRRGMLEGFSRVIEIGAQKVTPEFARSTLLLDELYSLFRKAPPDLSAPETPQKEGLTKSSPDDASSSRKFWETLGFQYKAIDFDGRPESVGLDLNRDAVPSDMKNHYHIVVNAGTTEHVANQEQAFRVVHDLTAVGGIMMHVVPAGGLMNHGLINYNSKFFWHLCRENGYEVLALQTVSPGESIISDDIFVTNKRFGRYEHNVAGLVVPDFYILASLRKVSDAEFVTPFDQPPNMARR